MIAFVFHRWDDVQFVLLGMAVVLVVARLFGSLARRVGQPAVVGEVIAGIALGSTVLGHWSTDLFPPQSRPALKLLATLGVVIFMFLVGLDLDMGHLPTTRRRTAGAVAVLGT